ncbi:MAG: metal-dependent hydrolase, partial [Thermoplasmata archaeon]|nr:metal-dependent hydrolase [Thermoplasmata archaeon]
IFPSIIASERNIREALRQGARFMLESDYLDDMRRPGAVIPPATIAKKTKKLLSEGTMSEESAFKIHKENPENVYGIEIV